MISVTDAFLSYKTLAYIVLVYFAILPNVLLYRNHLSRIFISWSRTKINEFCVKHETMAANICILCLILIFSLTLYYCYQTSFDDTSYYFNAALLVIILTYNLLTHFGRKWLNYTPNKYKPIYELKRYIEDEQYGEVENWLNNNSEKLVNIASSKYNDIEKFNEFFNKWKMMKELKNTLPTKKINRTVQKI